MLRNLIEKYDLKARIKGFFKNTVMLDNAYGYYCPSCSKTELDKPTAFVQRMFDEKYHCYKKFIKCDSCGITTPAYEKLDDAVDSWANLLVLEEDRLLLENEK